MWEPCWRFRVALGTHWGGLRVALCWLYGGYGVAISCLSTGLGVALGWLWAALLECRIKSAECRKPAAGCRLRLSCTLCSAIADLRGALCSKPGAMGAVWGRSDVDCANLCYCDTYEIGKVALGASVCPVQRRRSPGAGPARLPRSALKLLRLSHLWRKFCILRSRPP